ncbi:BSCL2 [Lepeophtheirus salmonis]|uniref:Seipin n=1 Tax=Lepeophtheirus salmonis TaxID=72036 RepID=A0A7R8CNM0_LEPSM|nr:BSCL2 [Lepeophtheirus salmonis]CAF2876618.1 BSCL2 [Lepeophtheirus salmonis]
MIPEHLSPPRTWFVCLFFRTRNFILSTIGISLLVSLVIWIAVMLYGSFYYFYMGVHLHDFDLTFHFKSCDNDELTRCGHLESHEIPFQEYYSQMDYEKNYSVSVELILPPSEKNVRHGMFRVCLFLDEERCQAGLMRYKSSYLRNLENSLLLPFYLLGIFSEGEYETVDIILWDEFKPKLVKGVSIQPRVYIKSASLDVLSAKLKIHPKLWGLRYFILLVALWYDFLSKVVSRNRELKKSQRKEQISKINTNLQRVAANSSDSKSSGKYHEE